MHVDQWQEFSGDIETPREIGMKSQLIRHAETPLTINRLADMLEC